MEAHSASMLTLITASNDQDNKSIGPPKRLSIDRKNKKPGKDCHLVKLGGLKDPQIPNSSHEDTSSLKLGSRRQIDDNSVSESNSRKSHMPVHLMSLDAIAVCNFPSIGQSIRRIGPQRSLYVNLSRELGYFGSVPQSLRDRYSLA